MIKRGWFYCDCGKKSQKIDDKTTIIGELYCRDCKKKYDVIIINGELIKKGIKND